MKKSKFLILSLAMTAMTMSAGNLARGVDPLMSLARIIALSSKTSF